MYATFQVLDRLIDLLGRACQRLGYMPSAYCDGFEDGMEEAGHRCLLDAIAQYVQDVA